MLWPLREVISAMQRNESGLIRQMVAIFGGLSRLELAQTVCEHLKWRTATVFHGNFFDNRCEIM